MRNYDLRLANGHPAVPHFGWQAVSVLILVVSLVMGGARFSNSYAAEKLTPENVAQTLVPQLFHLHLSQHDFSPEFTKRMLKEYLNQLDCAHRFYLKSEADAIINKSDEELKKLAERSLAADFSTWQGILEDFLKVQIARDEKLYDGFEGHIDEIKKEAEKRGAASKTVATPKPEEIKKSDPACSAADQKGWSGALQTGGRD